MNSFHSARIKLTLWYVAFVMLLSIVFSVGVYRVLTIELAGSLHEQSMKLYSIQGRRVAPNDLLEIYNDASGRILHRIILVNIGILLLSAGTSYFLAGKTLKPLEAAIEEQKRFIADASHELKTPLTSIKTEIEVALRDKKLTRSDAKALLKSNLEEVDKMKQLTNYLLALSRYENTNKNLQFTKVSVSDVLDRSIKLVTPKAEEKKITIINNVNNFSVKGNASGLEELFVILLDNAVKYSVSAKTITVQTKTTRHHGIVEIVDQGIGIKEGDIPYIFNRFYRADTSRSKHTSDGYGLGLSIAKSIVSLHKGKIEVVSTPGKGSTFKVTLSRH
jgi:two-component system, OmpR family, sensor histidine kinase CiaH